MNFLMKYRMTMLRVGLVLALAGLVAAPFTSIGCKGVGAVLDATGAVIGGNAGHALSAAGKGLAAAMMDESDEKDLGKSVVVVATNNYPVYDVPALSDYVGLVGMTAANAAPPSNDFQYTMGVLDTPKVNAFSGPGGYVMITRGAIQNMRDESELAGVLAHEVAHCTLHHGLEAVRQAGFASAISEAAAANKNAAKWGTLVDCTADTIFVKGYGQSQEEAADLEAVKYLVGAGYDPNGYVRFLQRMAAKQTGPSAAGGVMSTHPGLSSRIAKVQALITQMNVRGGATLADRFNQRTAMLPKVQ